MPGLEKNMKLALEYYQAASSCPDAEKRLWEYDIYNHINQISKELLPPYNFRTLHTTINNSITTMSSQLTSLITQYVMEKPKDDDTTFNWKLG